MQPEAINHVINKRSSEVVSAKKGCIDGCISAEHQKSKISEIEPDVKEAKDEADQDKSAPHTTTVEFLIEENSETVVEQEIVDDKKPKPKSKKPPPCVAVAAFIESLLSSQESEESKESILEELYEYDDQLKNSSGGSDEQYEVTVEDVSEFSRNRTVPKKKPAHKNVSDSLYHVFNDSVKVERPEALSSYTDSNSEESSSSTSPQGSTTDSSESSLEDSSSYEQSLSPHTNGKILQRIKTTRVTKTRKLSKLLPPTTEISTANEDQTASADDSSLYTAESLTGANDSATTTKIPFVTKEPVKVNAHVVVLKGKDKSLKTSNITKVIKETKIVKHFQLSDEDSDSPIKNVTEVASLADIEVVTETVSDTTDRSVAIVDIHVTLTEDVSRKPKHRLTDTAEESVESTSSTPIQTTTYLEEDSSPKLRVTDVLEESTTKLPDVDRSSEKPKRPGGDKSKTRVKEAKDLACINRLSSKYPFLKLLFQKNSTSVVQSSTVFVPIPLDYLPHISNSHSEAKQKSCKRLRILIAKILEALSKLDVPVESLIKATSSKHSKRQARDIRQHLLSQISNLSAEHVED